MNSLKLSILLAVLMVSASVAGLTIRPSKKAQDVGASISLEDAVPKQFGDWKMLPSTGSQIVNPQTQQLLDKLYSQILTRTYVNSQGYGIMLSLAYGDDQRGGLQAHKPEVCYPAQGFKLHDKHDRAVKTDFGDVDSRRLQTSLGARSEPITYWIAVGGQTALERHEKRLAEIKLALTGQIPDGLIFRVSSIDPDANRAYAVHDQFVNELLRAVTPVDRRRLAGLGNGSKAGGS